MIDLTGHVALITGGNGGIGLGMATGLANAGADVAIWGTNPDKNDAASEQLAKTDRGEGGALVAVASTSAIHGAPFNPHYAASKTGLLGLVRALAVGLARHRIRANALLPGWTDTELMAPNKENPKFVSNTISRTPV